jgi:hypothetical protein
MPKQARPFDETAALAMLRSGASIDKVRRAFRVEFRRVAELARRGGLVPRRGRPRKPAKPAARREPPPRFTCAGCGRRFAVGEPVRGAALRLVGDRSYMTVLGGRPWCDRCAAERFRRHDVRDELWRESECATSLPPGWSSFRKSP